MFKLSSKVSALEKVRGFLMTPIKYEVRVPTANWSPWFGDYQKQKWGTYDSDSCWALSAINCFEDQLEWLYKNGMFSTEAKNFFSINGYLDEDGDFSLSERFLEILSGVRNGGNDQMQAGILAQKYGCIPRSLLNYSDEKANSFDTNQEFLDDYFNHDDVTVRMLQLGQQFLKYVNISRQYIGSLWQTPNRDILIAAIKQTPPQIGIPIEDPNEWNTGNVPYKGTRTVADHAVELYAIDTDGSYLIFDQYEPHLKRLAPNYYIPIVTQYILNAVNPVIVNPIPQPQGYTNDTFWSSVMNWFNKIFGTVTVGKVV